MSILYLLVRSKFIIFEKTQGCNDFILFLSQMFSITSESWDFRMQPYKLDTAVLPKRIQWHLQNNGLL